MSELSLNALVGSFGLVSPSCVRFREGKTQGVGEPNSSRVTPSGVNGRLRARVELRVGHRAQAPVAQIAKATTSKSSPATARVITSTS